MLLSVLPKSEYEQLEPDLQEVTLTRGEILYNPYEVYTYAYFPQTAMISLVTTMEDGATTEVSLVGNEGIIGLPIILGGEYDPYQAMVQVGGTALKLDGEILEQRFQQSGSTFQTLLLLYTQAQLTRAAQMTACNRQHTIQERLARWLLSVYDCVQQEELPLTQEFIATMLGTQRSGVTIAANVLQTAGMIQYHRGKITITNRELLEEVACECYHIIKSEYDRLLGVPRG